MELLPFVQRLVRRSLIKSGVSSQFVKLQGLDVHFYRVHGRGGNGPPVLLVHGLGSSANDFASTLVPLAKHFSAVYAVDLPANGFSPMPSTGPVPVRQQLDLLLEFRRQVIGEPVFLLGNSLGGGMALNMAFQDPAALRALGLICPAGAPVSAERFEQLVSSFQIQDAAGGRALARKLFHRAPLPLLLFGNELRKRMAAPAVRSLVAEFSPADMVEASQVRALSMPILLIWGQSEKLLPYEGLDFFRSHLPNHAEIHEVKGFGHMPQVEHPAAFIERVTRFAISRGLVIAS